MLTAETIILIVGLLLLAVSAVAAVIGHLTRRRRKHAKLTTPTPGVNAAIAPDEMRPAMVGALDDGEISQKDLLVTLIDLAARGYLILSPLRDKPEEEPYDWQIKRTARPVDGLTQFEKVLVTMPFEDRREDGRMPTVSLTNLAREDQPVLQASRRKLVEQLTDLGWLAAHERKSTRWGWVGGLVAVIGLLITAWMIFAWLADDDATGLIGSIAIIAAGLLLASAGHTKAHSAEAEDVVRELASYRAFLLNDLPERLTPANLAPAFNQHLPWAMQLNIVDEFTAAFDDYARRAEGWGTGQRVRPQWLTDIREGQSAAEIGELVTSIRDINDAPRRRSRDNQ